MVDYRGPKFLQSLCERWNLELFDRVVEIQLLEPTDLLQDSVQTFPELQTLTLSPLYFNAEDLNVWSKLAEQVHSLPNDVFLNVYEVEGRWVPDSLVVLGAARVEPWKTPAGRTQKSLPAYFQDREDALAKAVQSALQNARQEKVATSCVSDVGSLVCAGGSPIP